MIWQAKKHAIRPINSKNNLEVVGQATGLQPGLPDYEGIIMKVNKLLGRKSGVQPGFRLDGKQLFVESI